MRKARIRRRLICACALLAAFVVLIVAVKVIDVKPIGPEGSEIGLAGVNRFFQNLTGYIPACYTVTQLLGYLALLLAACFAALGAYQLISRRSLLKVDPDLLALAAAYALTVFFYVLFEVAVINYRPVIVDAAEGLEASFPSSHTMMATVIFGTAMTECRLRLKDKGLRKIARAVFAALIGGMTFLRLISGVHWFTDILGGGLLGSAIACLYSAAADTLILRKKAMEKRRRAG